MSAAELDRFTGLYRNEVRGDTFRIVRDGSALRLGDGTPLIAVSARRLTDGDGLVIDVAESGSGRMDDGSGSEIPIQRVKEVRPTVGRVGAVAGTTRVRRQTPRSRASGKRRARAYALSRTASIR